MQALNQEVEAKAKKSDEIMDAETSKRVDAAIDGYFKELKNQTEVPEDLIEKITGSGKSD